MNDNKPNTQTQPSKKWVFPPIGLNELPSLPAPWSGIDAGEAWVWGDFFMTFQKEPRMYMEVLQEALQKIQGRKSGFFHG